MGIRSSRRRTSSVLHNQLVGLDIPVAGLVKNNKHKTSEFTVGDDLQPIQLERNSVEFFLLQESKMKFIGLPLLSTDNCAARTVSLQIWSEIPGLGPTQNVSNS